MIARFQNNQEILINVAGSSTFGRYPKISAEKTYNMFLNIDSGDGDEEAKKWLVPYSGYQVAIPSSSFKNGSVGRGIYSSTKLNRLVVVIDENVFLVNIFFDQNLEKSYDTSVIKIGELSTARGVVYIAENNKPQILISDSTQLYLYDATLSPAFRIVSGIDFIPGQIDFHDTYFLCAAQVDKGYDPPATNIWRLSGQNDGLSWPSDASSVGILQTKPDNIKAVVRFPSKGNAIIVIGQTVAEPWYDVGYQLFPYQRNASLNMDYGCLNPATIAATDTIVVWLAQNEKSGPTIVYSDGSDIKKISTDGIDYLFSQLTNPADSRAFIYRQDGHLFYHINFYTDNISLFYDFNTGKFYHACDENLNYFIADCVAFFNNQYYFLSKNDGNLYAFDTIFTTYDGKEIPRIRICKSIRNRKQEFFIINDLGFTIETGQIPYQKQTDGSYVAPKVSLSFSKDGGYSFGSDISYEINNQAYGINKLMFWNLGYANDFIPMFKFWGMGRFVCTDGIANIRQ
jgi:hypothetical protein